MKSTSTNLLPRRWMLVPAVASWTYPLALVGSLYLTWAVAWMVLGRPPRPSLDDPKSISGRVDVPYDVTLLFLIGSPAAMIGGIAVITCFGMLWKVGTWRIVLGLAVLALVWAATIAFLRWDPWRIGKWFMD